MYDDACRFLAEHFFADFASWLLGKAVTLSELQPSELSLDPIRADALIFLQSDEAILHIRLLFSRNRSHLLRALPPSLGDE